MPDTDRAASRQIRILGAISLPHLDGCSPVGSTGRTTQAMGYRPGLVGPGLVRNTYTFPIKKVVVRGGRKIDYTRFCSTYKWAAVEALGVAPY
jgi:hypothetical protein